MLGEATFFSGSEDGDLPTMKGAISRLPATASLPTMTIPTISPPREKLESLLKEGDRLLRTTKTVLINKPKVGGAKLDGFLRSWKAQKLQREHGNVATTSIEQSTIKRALLMRLPSEIASVEPKISADNSPGDDLEIILTEKGGSRVGSASRSLLLIRQNIAPKVKTSSIDKLNSDLNNRIRQQQAKTEDERRREAVIAERLRREALLKQQVQEEEEAEVGFSDSSNIDSMSMGEEGTEEEIPTVTRESRFIHSDEETDGLHQIQPDFAQLPKKPKKSAIFAPEEDDDVDDLANLDKFDAKNNLTQILSGKFVDERSDSDAEPEESQDNIEALEAGELETNDTSGKIAFFDDEAEDEDSEVSADELDEESIARELQESAFVDDERDSGLDEANHMVIHRKLQNEADQYETDFFMNRFAPDSVLRETGTFGELKRKYTAVENAEYDEGKLDRVLYTTDNLEKAASMFGRAPNYSILPGISHPAFLQLLENDKLSSEYHVSDDDNSECDPDYSVDQEDTPLNTAVIAETEEFTFGYEAIGYSSFARVEDHSLTMFKTKNDFASDPAMRQRLAALTKENTDQKASRGAELKRKVTTFETVSSRPVLPKDKVMSKTKQK